MWNHLPIAGAAKHPRSRNVECYAPTMVGIAESRKWQSLFSGPVAVDYFLGPIFHIVCTDSGSSKDFVSISIKACLPTASCRVSRPFAGIALRRRERTRREGRSLSPHFSFFGDLALPLFRRSLPVLRTADSFPFLSPRQMEGPS